MTGSYPVLFVIPHSDCSCLLQLRGGTIVRKTARASFFTSAFLFVFCLAVFGGSTNQGSSRPAPPHTANVTEEIPPRVALTALRTSARAIGFEDYADGGLAPESGWRAQSGCGPKLFHIIDTRGKYPGFGLKALAVSTDQACDGLSFIPFSAGTEKSGVFEMQWDFAVQGAPIDSRLQVGVEDRRGTGASMELHASGIGIDVPGAKNNFARLSLMKVGTPEAMIHHALVLVDTTQGRARVSKYIDGTLVETSQKNKVDLASLARSFSIRSMGGGNAVWILDNFQFLSAPSSPNVSMVVSPDQMNGWGTLQETPTGVVSFVSGPETPPLGSGSAQFNVDDTGGVILATLSYGGRRLDQIRTLSYSTYHTGSGPQAISFQFDVDYDLTDGDLLWHGRLVYEPYFTETVVPGVWQTWEPRLGKWWATKPPGDAFCKQDAPCTWDNLHTLYPNAGVLLGGAVYLKAGGGWPAGNYNVDNLDIGFSTDASDNEWNFEPTVPCSATCYVDGVNGNNANGGANPSTAKKTIQAAINQVSAGGSVIVYPAIYQENLHVTKPMDLGGTDKTTVIIQPAVSDPSSCSGSSLCCPGSGTNPLSSNVILIESSNVTIHDLTVDGNNPSIGGAIDARNGIEENFCAGSFTNTVVHDTIVKNIYLRGIQSVDSTFSFHDNQVDNVQGDPAGSIAIFSFGGSGAIANNTVSNATDAIAANWSTGIQFVNNTVTASGSGIHTDNSHGYGDTGVSDLISNNTVSTGASGAYGIWSFVPYKNVTIQNNRVTNVDVGLGSFASAGGTAFFRNNTVTGSGATNSLGAYLSTFTVGLTLSPFDTNNSINMTGNAISNYGTGVYLESNAGYTLRTTANCNSIAGNSPDGVVTAGTGGAFVLDFTRNWWGSSTGPNHSTNPLGAGNRITGDVPFSPWNQDTTCSLFAGIPTRLAFQVQPPASTPLYSVLAPAVKVRAEDSSGNLGINFTGTVNLSFVINPTGATLGGTLGQPAIAGVATFNDLTVSQIGSGYRLGAMTPAGLTGAVSNSFNIVAPPAPTDVWVDDDWAPLLIGAPVMSGAHHIGYDAFAVIQDGVNAVATGSTVHVFDGTYTEQIDIPRAMTLQGQSQANTIIHSPATLVTKFTTSGGDNKPIVYAHLSDSITIDTLTIDGLGIANANPRMFGVAYYNSGGMLKNCTIKKIRETPLGGAGNGVGIYAVVDLGSHGLTIDGNTVTDYEKNGMALSGAGLTVTVNNNIVTGKGVTGLLAQNGIQVSYGAVGSITNNTVTANSCSGNPDCDKDPATVATADGAAGILLYGPGASSVTISGNTLSDNQFAVWSVGAPAVSISGNAISGTGSAGVSVWDCDQWCSGLSVTPVPTTGTIQTNAIAGDAYGVLVRNVKGQNPTVSATNNSFLIASPSYGAWSNTATALDATCNYWNSVSGPTHAGNPGGVGAKASDHLIYSPWLNGVGGSCGVYAPTKLVFTQQPSSVVVNGIITPAVVVQAQDNSGHLATTFGGMVGLALTIPGGATLTGGGAVAAVNGVATFPGLSVNLVGTYNLSATTSSGLTPATSTSFDIIVGPPEVWVDDDWAPLTNGTTVMGGAHVIGLDAFAVIQSGVNAVASGGIVHILAGTYSENVIVSKSMEIEGAGQGSTILRPAADAPLCPGSPCDTLCDPTVQPAPPGQPASILIRVRANDVIIHDLTLDGSNPALDPGSGVVRGGVTVHARGGIVADYNMGTFTNLTVHHVTAKNIYLRGIYAGSPGATHTIDFNNNTVDNIQGDGCSIGIFSRFATGTVQLNTATRCLDAISSNWSQGLQFLNNTVSTPGTTLDPNTHLPYETSGIHTDNSGTGVNADTISGNQVAGYDYGVFVFVPYKAPTVSNNAITNAAIGLASFGGAFPPSSTVTPVFTGNNVSGRGTGVSGENYGFLITSDSLGFGETNVNSDLQDNDIINFREGIRVAPLTKTATLTGTNNVITQNGTGVVVAAGSSSVTLNQNSIFDNVTAGFSNQSASVASSTCTWWGSAIGPANTTLNPFGTGNSVSNNVTFVTWSTTAGPTFTCNGSFPGMPIITSITDNNPCLQNGIHINFTAAAGAVSYDLYRGGVSVVTGYASGALYNPGDSSSHTYVIRAVAGATHTDSVSSSFADAGGTVPPSVGDLHMSTNGTKLLITWALILPASQVDYYEVWRSLSAEGPFDTLVGTASGDLNGLQVDLNAQPLNAFYKVRAVKGVCPGPM